MNVLMVEPGMAPYEKELNGLKEMQAGLKGNAGRCRRADYRHLSL